MCGQLPDDFWMAMQELYKEEDGSLADFEEEKERLRPMVEAVATELHGTYAVETPIGRGGAGIVLKVNDMSMNTPRALKLPRPHGGAEVESVRNERENLRNLKHDNIIKIHKVGDVDGGEHVGDFPYFVMDYVSDAQDLRGWLLSRLDCVKHPAGVEQLTLDLADLLTQTASALHYLHQENTVHFDVKPSNILIAGGRKALVSDLGFAKQKADNPEQLTVGFTYFYAHPDLREQYGHMSDANRVRKPVAPCEFEFAWDLYALGKTVLELLARVDTVMPDAIHHDYCFSYLHLAACRMLDGRNLNQTEVDRIREDQVTAGLMPTCYRECWLNIDSPDALKDMKYGQMGDVHGDLRELSTDQRCGVAVPELAPSCVKRVQTSSHASGPFTDRVKAIVEHPCFSRLHEVPQLGLANAVYPGATHSRLEHSLGTFERCVALVTSLHQDPYNPLFRQLCSPDDLKLMLLAGLLHDVGQYPLAHEIEEIAPEFAHAELTVKWLDNPSLDKQGRRLSDIIAQDWGVKLDELKHLLHPSGETTNLFEGPSIKLTMMRSLIDGPLDADKLDYLLRDSENAFLRYGMLIDHDRLVRHVTTVVLPDDSGRQSAAIGTYEKGQAAAESLQFARYLLYQALYWHHTLRAIRAMLHIAVQGARQKERGGPGLKTLFEQFLGIKAEPKAPDALDVLDFLEHNTDEHGKKMVQMVRARNLYKRVLTVHSEPAMEEGRPDTLERFRQTRRSQQDFDEVLRDQLYQRLASYDATVTGPLTSALSPNRHKRTLEVLKAPNSIVTDCPRLSTGSLDKLHFMPEPERLRRNYYSRVEVGERVSEVWQQAFFKLMKIASKGRVFCHPDARDTIMAALGPEAIHEELLTAIERFD